MRRQSSINVATKRCTEVLLATNLKARADRVRAFTELASNSIAQPVPVCMCVYVRACVLPTGLTVQSFIDCALSYATDDDNDELIMISAHSAAAAGSMDPTSAH